MFILFILILFLLLLFLLLSSLSMNPSPSPSLQWSQWFIQRDLLPQSPIPINEWYSQNWNNGWGPHASIYPIPIGLSPNIVDISRHYIGLSYRHHHIPNWNPPSSLTGKPNESTGLDCSNFTSWVYNYGKGIKFTSNVQDQSEMYQSNPSMSRINWNMIQPGDILYFWRLAGNDQLEISHCGIFSGYKNGIPYLIDSHAEGVKERPMTNNTWYRQHFSHAIHINLN